MSKKKSFYIYKRSAYHVNSVRPKIQHNLEDIEGFMASVKKAGGTMKGNKGS